MALLTSRRLIAAGLLAATMLAAMPARWFAPWSPTLAAVVWLPMQPAAHGLALLRALVRTPAEPYPDRPEELRAALEERDRLQGELDGQRQRTAALEARLEELSGVWALDHRGGWRPVLATILERGGERDPALLRLDVGSTQGVDRGDPAVTGGNQLVGVITGPVESGRCWLAPLHDKVLGRIDALIYPAAKPNASPREAVLVQLVADEHGALVGEIGSGATVKPGDTVKLSDPNWAPAAQGMVLGIVERVGPLDANPLRTRVDVRPRHDPARLATVTVKIMDASAPARSPATPAPGREGNRPRGGSRP